MKRLATLVAVVMCLSLFALHDAAALEAPEGKNLMNPDDFVGCSSENAFYNEEPILVESGGTYTFSMYSQSFNWLIRITDGNDEPYIEEHAFELKTCIAASHQKIACTFEASDEELYMHFSEDYASMAFSHYGLEGMMLEEGPEKTAYEPYPTPSPPVFDGSGLLVASYQEGRSIEEIIDAHISAYDEIDGDVSEDIVVVEDAYTGNESSVGEYDVTLEVSDSAGNTASFVLTIQVKDEIPPVIEGPTTLKVDVDAPVDVEAMIAEHFSFYDEHDGSLEAFTISRDEYTGVENDLGEATVEFEVADSSGNVAEWSMTLEVEDKVAPEIHGPKETTIKLSDPDDLQTILGRFHATDNHTPADSITLEVLEATFDGEDRVGEYALVLEATDLSGNASTKTFTVYIVDDVAPTLEGPSNLERSYTMPFDVSEVFSLFTPSDNHCDLSSDDFYIISNEVVADVPGSYELILGVADSSGNTAEHTVTVHVIDDVPPVFHVDERIILTGGTTLSSGEILARLEGDPEVKAFNPIAHEVVHDEYTGAGSEAGSYRYEVEFLNRDGERMLHGVDIEIAEEEPETAEGGFRAIYLLLPLAGLSTLIFLKRRS